MKSDSPHFAPGLVSAFADPLAAACTLSLAVSPVEFHSRVQSISGRKKRDFNGSGIHINH